MTRIRPTVLLLALCTFLQACGGGGSGGGASGGTTGGGGSGGGTTPSLYGGSEAQAALSPTNAARFVGVVLDSSALGDGFTAVSLTSATGKKVKPQADGSLGNLPRLARRIHERAIASALGKDAPQSGGFQIAERIDETENCGVSGTARTTGDVDANGIGSVTVSFSACRDSSGAPTINGTTRLTVRSRLGFSGATATDATTNFDDLTLTTGAESFRLQGRIDVRRTQQSEQSTINLTTRDNSNNTAVDLRNFVVTRSFLVNEPGEDERYAGRVYLSDLGYVDVSTPTGFVFANAETTTPSRRGSLVLAGANSSRVEFGVVSGDASRLRLDANGDGNFEVSVALAFTALSDGTANDLADSDGDGMHNSWERAYGLNPNDAADADRDADGDGASNRQEHVGLGRPDRADSLPRGPADLAVTLERISPATADTNSFVRYRLRLANLGPRLAERPTIALAVTNGGSPAQGESNFAISCGGTQCTANSLPAGQSHVTILTVASGTVGADTVLTARASSLSIDPVPANDSATVSTPVRELSLSTISVELLARGSLVYAPSLGEFVGAGPGNIGDPMRLVFISPGTGATRFVNVPMTGAPTFALTAITSDASTIYVGSRGEGTIERVDVASGTPGQSSRASSELKQVLTVPGRNGDTIALSQRNLEYFRNGVTLYAEAAAPGVIALSSDGRFLFLVGNDFTGSSLRRYPITAEGLGAPVTIATVDPFNTSVLGVGGGVVVLGDGTVFDEATGAQRGSIGSTSTGLVLVDGANSRIYVVPRFAPGLEPGRRLRVFDIATLALLHDVDLPFTCEELYRWGEDGLACRTPSSFEFGRSAALVRE